MPAAQPLVHPAPLGDLQNNLRKADEIADAQLAAVSSLMYVEGFLAQLGIKAAALKRLRYALGDVLDGHERSLFKPRRSSKPGHTFRRRAIQVYAALLMQSRRDIGEGEETAAKAVEKILGKAGFRLSQGTRWQKATAGTVINWRKGLTSKLSRSTKRHRWASDLYRRLLKQLRPSSVYRLMGGDEMTACKQAVKVAENVLKSAVAENLES